VTVGVAAFFAEGLDNPEVSWRWKGWREEGEELRQLTASLLHFSVQEWHNIKQVLVRGDKKNPRT
jgi:hypothetical protein